MNDPIASYLIRLHLRTTDEPVLPPDAPILEELKADLKAWADTTYEVDSAVEAERIDR